MESLGTLAGGIAHDFNNYLTGIFGYLDLAVTNTRNEKVTEYLSRVLASSDRARSLTRQLLTFSKGGAPVKADGHLVPFLQEFSKQEKNFSGSGPVLIMDDEKMIRDMLAQMLDQMGFVVTAAANGQDAVKLFAAARNSAAPFLAVILDLTIPGGMGGKQAAAHIRKLDQQVPLIVASGYSEDAAIASPQAFGFTAAIEKPFLRSDLATTLFRCLGR